MTGRNYLLKSHDNFVKLTKKFKYFEIISINSFLLMLNLVFSTEGKKERIK